MSQPQDAAPPAARYAQIEDALAHYPHIGEERLAVLIAWFRTEASALDVAMLASNQAIAEPYRRFRADHIDPMTGKDVMRGLIALAFVSAIILVIVWRTL